MGWSVQDVAQWVGGRVVNGDALGPRLSQIWTESAAALGVSTAQDIAYFFSRDYERELLSARPGILITGEAFVAPLQASGLPIWKESAIIACRDPYLAMATLSEKVAARVSTVVHAPGARPRIEPEIHASAVVHPLAKIGLGASIGAHAVIEEEAEIGPGAVIYPGCYVGPRCQVGEDSVLFPNVTVYELTIIGKRVRIHSGCVLGADGFGYAPVVDESRRPIEHRKIHHIGRVIIGDDAELGAGTLVDRGTLGPTVIGPKAKLDNRVHIAHNCSVGEGAILCGASGMAGSSSVGDWVYIGGAACIANQVHVGDYAKIGGASVAFKDVPPGAEMLGNPLRKPAEHFRIQALLNKLLAERRGRKKPDSKDDA